MRKLIFVIALIPTVIIASCQNSGKTMTSVSGDYTFTMVVDSATDAIAHDQLMVLDMKGTGSDDSLWFENPMMVIKMDTARWNNKEVGILEVMLSASKGDSLTLRVSAQDFFEKTAKDEMPSEVTEKNIEYFDFAFRVKEVLAGREEYMEYMNKLAEEKMKEQMGDTYVEPAEQAKIDDAAIQQYLTEKGLEATKTEEGLYVIITQEGTGENFVAGDKINVAYHGYMMDGTVFDTSIEEKAKEAGVYREGRPYRPYPVTVDATSVIRGWHVGLKQLKNGSKATFIIPSGLAYGMQGSGPVIKPNSVILFDVEVEKIEE